MVIKIKGNGKEFYRIFIKLDAVTIGRSSGNEFVIPLEDFSRQHCTILKIGKFYYIEDLGSKNGVSIDGHKILPNVPSQINPGSVVIIANFYELKVSDEHI